MGAQAVEKKGYAGLEALGSVPTDFFAKLLYDTSAVLRGPAKEWVAVESPYGGLTARERIIVEPNRAK